MTTGYTTTFEIFRELVKGVTFKHKTGFLVKFGDDGELIYTNNGIAWGTKKTGPVDFDKPSDWIVSNPISKDDFIKGLRQIINRMELGIETQEDQSLVDQLIKHMEKETP